MFHNSIIVLHSKLNFMKIKILYFLLFIIGSVIPYYFFLPFLLKHGLDIKLIISELTANNISIFFSIDVIISAIVLIIYIIYDQNKIKVQYFALAILATLTIGVSSGLPLYLLLKERTKDFLRNLNGN